MHDASEKRFLLIKHCGPYTCVRGNGSRFHLHHAARNAVTRNNVKKVAASVLQVKGKA